MNVLGWMIKAYGYVDVMRNNPNKSLKSRENFTVWQYWLMFWLVLTDVLCAYMLKHTAWHLALNLVWVYVLTSLYVSSCVKPFYYWLLYVCACMSNLSWMIACQLFIRISLCVNWLMCSNHYATDMFGATLAFVAADVFSNLCLLLILMFGLSVWYIWSNIYGNIFVCQMCVVTSVLW